MSDKKERDPAVAWFYAQESERGTYYTSGRLNEEQIDEITSILRAGGKLKFSEVKAEKVQALLTFIPPEKVQAQYEAYQNRVGKKETNRVF